MYPGSHDTIHAVASAPGTSERALIRISGAQAFELLRSVARADVDGRLSRGVWAAQLVGLGRCPLPVLLLVMPAPRSFTGEDTAELIVPGNPLLLERIAGLFRKAAIAGALSVRPARAGEFTARAFLSGRLTAADADAVLIRISARSEGELRAAEHLEAHDLSRDAQRWSDGVAQLLALVEAGIDFTDEQDVVAISSGMLRDGLAELRRSMTARLAGEGVRERRRVLPRVVIAGSPNAGKSTLFNAMLGRSRVVASPVRGATRDVIEEAMVLSAAGGPVQMILVDTAGSADDLQTGVDAEAALARQAALDQADLILLCAPIGSGVETGADPRVILVRTMRDLGSPARPDDSISISALTGQGLDELRARVVQRLLLVTGCASGIQNAVLERYEAELRLAVAELHGAAVFLEGDDPERSPRQVEYVAHAMRTALDHLGAVAGEEGPDDLLGRIFSSFCVGK